MLEILVLCACVTNNFLKDIERRQEFIGKHDCYNKKHLKYVGPIHHCVPPHAHSADVASGTVACRLRIDVVDNDNDDDDDDDNV